MQIYTSCYDGFVRLMDAEKEVFDLVYSSDETIYTLSQPKNDENCLYFGEGRGGLTIWDNRMGKCSSQWVLHGKRINTIDFNSENPNIMATSSSDETACIWDLRYNHGDKLRALRTFTHQGSVQSAYFSPSGCSLATTRYTFPFWILIFLLLKMSYGASVCCLWCALMIYHCSLALVFACSPDSVIVIIDILLVSNYHLKIKIASNKRNPHVNIVTIFELWQCNSSCILVFYLASPNCDIGSGWSGGLIFYFSKCSLDNTIGIISGVNYENGSTISHNNHTGRWLSTFRLCFYLIIYPPILP